jgi:hypothetical protein
MLMCGCTSDVEPLSPSEEPVSPQHCDYNDVFVERDTEENSLLEGENGTTADIAKCYLDRISEQLAALNEKKGETGSRQKRPSTARSNSVFRTETPGTDSEYPSIKHNASESTQSTTSLSFDEEDEPHHDEPQQPKIVSILRRKEKMAPIRIEASGAGVRFSPSTVFPEATGKRKLIRRKPRITQTYTEDQLRRIERRSQQNQHNASRFSPYLSSDTRSPSSELLYPTESFYVFR